MEKETNDEDVSFPVLQPTQKCEFSSHGSVGQCAHHLHPSENKLKTRITRSKRHTARQVSRHLKASFASVPSPTPPSKSARSRKTSRSRSTSKNNKSNEEDFHTIYTHDNVKLVSVLNKVLTSSDVTDRGRIVLPKREAEEYLPRLSTKEGTIFIMRDILSNTEWQLSYRFWDNYRGRIYVLYHCGDFVRKNNLEAGDKLILYQDVFKNVYFTITKKKKKMQSREEGSSSKIFVDEPCEATERTTTNADGTCRRDNIPVTIQFF